jgi:hypothetical protein
LPVTLNPALAGLADRTVERRDGRIHSGAAFG